MVPGRFKGESTFTTVCQQTKLRGLCLVASVFRHCFVEAYHIHINILRRQQILRDRSGCW